MEPPPAPAITATASSTGTPPTSVAVSSVSVSVAATNYPDSIDSSPRSRATDFDDSFPSATAGGKLRLMCSYGGHIVPRPHDKSLCYVGGDTRIVVVDRSTTLSDLQSRLSKTLLNGRQFTLKYQLPNEDLDSLISVSTEEDLDNMVDEYDRLISNSNPAKPSRIRLFLFPSKPEGASSIGSILDGSNRSEDWFLNALNGAAAIQRGFSDPASVNCLLGLEENGNNFGNSDSKEMMEAAAAVAVNRGGGGGGGGGISEGKLGKLGNQNQSNPDIHSVPDSPIIETTSSFGSTNSSPSLANLPPIRVHVEDGSSRVSEQQRVGIEEQFAQMGVSSVQNQKQQGEETFVVLSSPAPPVVTGVPAEFPNRVFSDDERSDHGVPVGYRKPQQQPAQPPIGQPVMTSQSQAQHKQMGGGELPSPDSVSSDSSLSNAISRQKPVVYQDPSAQMSSGSNRLPANFVDPNTRIQMQQISETGYTLALQYDQQQQQFLQQHHFQQQHQQQQQQQPQQGQTQPQPQAQPQQYIPAGAHFVHHPAGAVPMSTYYPMYQPQQPHHQPHQYPVYYVQAGQAQAYSLPVQQQPNLGEPVNAVPSSRPQTPPNPTIITASSAYNPTRNVPPSKPDMPPGVYRTGASAGPQLVQVPSSQHQTQSQPQPTPQQQQQQQQFMGYSQIHHQSQSIPPNSTANAGYTYEFTDPSHAQIYYTQPLAPPLAAQYQAVTSGATMVMADNSSQLSNDNLKQQIRSSQPL